MSTRTILRCTFAFLAGLLLSDSAHALLFRAYLAADGNDAQPCTLAQPCRLLPAALTAVADGGEIWMLDSANYNTSTVTIGKSVSILAVPGVVGSVVAAGGNAIDIPTSSLKVALRNLVIVPLPGGGGISGVQMLGNSVLTVENCLFANLPGNGIYVAGTGRLRLANSTLRGVPANAGLYLHNGATADISGSQFLDNGSGVILFSDVAAATIANVSDSIFSGNGFGIQAGAAISGGVVRALVTRSTFQSGSYGIYSAANTAGASAVVAIGSSMISNNTSAYNVTGAGAVIHTMGNNQITDNGGSTGSLTLTPLQ